MVHGLGSDLALIGLTSVAVVAGRALHGSTGMRCALIALTLFAGNLVLDLVLTIGAGLPSTVRAIIAVVGLLIYVAGGAAVIAALIDELMRGYGSGGGRPAWDRLSS